jgi:hypothetical protein
MFSRRGFLAAVFGASLGAVTRPVGAVVEALTTRKAANQVLSFCTDYQLLDAKMFFIPYIPLLTPVQPRVRETVYMDGQLTSDL